MDIEWILTAVWNLSEMTDLTFPTFIQNNKKHKHLFWLLLIFVVWDSWPSWFDFGTSFPPDALPDALPTSSGLGTSTENTLFCSTPVSEVGSLALNWTWVTSVRALKLNHLSSSDPKYRSSNSPQLLSYLVQPFCFSYTTRVFESWGRDHAVHRMQFACKRHNVFCFLKEIYNKTQWPRAGAGRVVIVSAVTLYHIQQATLINSNTQDQIW